MTNVQSVDRPDDRTSAVDWGGQLVRSATILLCLLHGVGVWIAMGGREGMANDWPPLRDDHGLHYHHGQVTRHFLRSTGMTAGYDPAFMSGYPMSIVSDLSSTLSDLVMLASGDRPALGYKIHVFGCAALLPWLIVLAAVAWKARPVAVLIAVFLFLNYFWTDARNYAWIGMMNFLLSVPLGLLAVAGLSGYCDRGGFGRWFWAWAACSAVFLVHLTSPMVVGPAGLLAYAVASIRLRGEGRAFPASRHAGFWAMVPLILVVNAFWLLPGYLLASTKGENMFAFSHPESVWGRIFDIVWNDKPITAVALALSPIGLVTLGRRQPVAAAALGGFLAAGFGWGYLAGPFRALDVLQPGRNTYACYAAACVAAGIGLAEVLARLRATRSGRLDWWFAVALLVLAVRFLGPSLEFYVREVVFSEDLLLSCRPTPRMLWVVEKVRKHVSPGERLLFEETGVEVAGLRNPFPGRHCSPILPAMTGVEVLGGPYLHSTVTTNFTQFGENKLFENPRWDREFFVRYGKLYRPAAICCFSPKARAFCSSNPDLIRVVEDDGMLLLGRVIGFEGATIRGSAKVEAGPNRLVVRDAVADAGGDGLVVLRYHAVPYLKADPPVEIEPVKLEDDPVPFIGLKPTKGPITIEMVLPPRSWPGRSR
jgi:hypothetical protein